MMKRVLILGSPGAGKSTFAWKLQSKTKLPLVYMDQLFWHANKTTVSKHELDEKVKRIVAKPAWIMDGNYQRTLKYRLPKCDTIFWLDYPTEVCLAGVKARKGKPRPDLPWIEEDEDPKFMSYIAKFRTVQRPILVKELQKYPNKQIIVFHSRQEANLFLHKIR